MLTRIALRSRAAAFLLLAALFGLVAPQADAAEVCWDGVVFSDDPRSPMDNVSVELRNTEGGDPLATATTTAEGKYVVRAKNVLSVHLWVIYIPNKCEHPGPQRHVETARKHARGSGDPDNRHLPDVFLSPCSTPKGVTAAGRLLANGVMFGVFRGETSSIDLLSHGLAAWREPAPEIGRSVDDLGRVVDSARKALDEFGLEAEMLEKVKPAITSESLADAFIASWLREPTSEGQLSYPAVLARIAQYTPTEMPTAWTSVDLVHNQLATLAGLETARQAVYVTVEAVNPDRPAWSGALPALRLPDGDLSPSARLVIAKMVAEHRDLLPWSVYQSLLTGANSPQERISALQLLEKAGIVKPLIKRRQDPSNDASPPRKVNVSGDALALDSVSATRAAGKVRIRARFGNMRLDPGESLAFQVARDEEFRDLLVSSVPLDYNQPSLDKEVLLTSMDSLFIRLVVLRPDGSIRLKGDPRSFRVE